jgi:aspartyl-tRNA(Asn)/glutamyl-tRNA(Gln) amidotransferase subunit C
MTLSLKEVEHIARLARLALSDDEKRRYAAQLSSILEYAARLQAVDTAGLSPASESATAQEPAQPHCDGLRLDDPQPGLNLDDLQANAPQMQNRQFRMPPVFE